MTVEKTKQTIETIWSEVYDKLYKDCFKEANLYYNQNKLSRLPKIGKDAELYDIQKAKYEKLYEQCNENYNSKIETVTYVEKCFNDKLNFVLWGEEIDELNTKNN